MATLASKRDTKFVWVVGFPRSGTTLVADVVGAACDYVFNEPGPPYERFAVADWEFPAAGAIAFKYCENYRCADALVGRFPGSLFVHVLRDPDNAVHSMVCPKADAWPRRDFPEMGSGVAERAAASVARWLEYVQGCRRLAAAHPGRCLEVRYERLPEERCRLADFLGLAVAPFPFTNRNVAPEELAYLQPFWAGEAAELRRAVRDAAVG